MADIIGEVRIDPPQPRPGQTVTVEVFDEHGVSLADRADVTTFIDGIPGARRKLQFPAKGERRIRARAITADDDHESATSVAVDGAPVLFTPPGSTGRQRQPALLHVEQSRTDPYRVRFTLGEHPRRGRLPRPGRPVRSTRTTLDRATGLFDADANSLTTILRDRFRDVSPTSLSSSNTGFNVVRGRLGSTVLSRTALGDTAAGTTLGTSVLGRAGSLTSTTPVSAREFIPRPPRGATVVAADAVSGLLGSIDIGRFLDLGPEQPFTWDFGDGMSVAGRATSVEHDYSRDLEPDQDIMTFDVTCRVGADQVEVTRTLTLHSAYAIARKTGVLSPPVKSASHASKSGSGFSARLAVSNIEHEPITITHRAITPLTDDPDAIQAPKMTKLRRPITIEARSDATIGSFAAFGAALPWNAAGFDVHFAGTSASGMPVRFCAAFDIALRDRWWAPAKIRDAGVVSEVGWRWDAIARAVDTVSTAVSPGLTARLDTEVGSDDGVIVVRSALNALRLGTGDAARAADRIIDAGVAIDVERIHEATLAGALVRTGGFHAAPSSAGLHFRPFGTDGIGSATLALSAEPPPQPGPVLSGQICDPDNITAEQAAEADDAQLVCQLTDEEIEALMPGRFMNARKGDVILSPGGPGLVGALLRRVNPSQLYSHSGIMTRNYDEVTHSTASEKRIKDYLVGFTSDGSDGIRPDIIKWMWPGVVAQPVEAAVNGEPWVDPENGQTYSISSFSAHAVGVSDNDNFVIVPPMVVKPDPMLETPEIRAKLHEIAAIARSEAARPDTAIKSHYRLFCYTDPTIGLTDSAPAESGWAQGTFPSVCSSFIWMMAKRTGTKLESDQPNVMPGELEPPDVAAGAEVMPTTPDGLYRYTAAERRAAGQWLYDELYNEAHEEAGWFGVLLTDAADDLASEVVNTFAIDDPDKDSDAWEQTGDANAVSPDNILWWDGPDKGGLYGYAEPLIYREPRIETYTISRWKKVIKRSDVTGRVTMGGGGIGGAMVQAYDGKTTFTAADGTYRLDDVPIGPYQFKASKVIDGIYHSVKRSVTLNDENEVVDLVLEPPEERFRLAKVFFDFDGREDEDWPWDDETTNPGPEYRELELGPQRLTNQFTRTYKWGGEARAEYTFDLSLLVDNSVRVQVRCLLYEGTSENTSDLDGQGVASFVVPIDQTGATVLMVRNTAEDEPDTFGRMAVTVENSRNNN